MRRNFLLPIIFVLACVFVSTFFVLILTSDEEDTEPISTEAAELAEATGEPTPQEEQFELVELPGYELVTQVSEQEANSLVYRDTEGQVTVEVRPLAPGSEAQHDFEGEYSTSAGAREIAGVEVQSGVNAENALAFDFEHDGTFYSGEIFAVNDDLSAEDLAAELEAFVQAVVNR